VLNQSEVRGGRPYAPRALEDFRILPGAAEAVARLKAAGFRTIVVTNQKDVGAGLVAADVVEAMHEKLRAAMPLDAIHVCTCTDECPCYKPNPGMLLEAAEAFGIDLARSYMVGDRWRDIGAGARAGCRTIFIDRGYDEALRDVPDHRAADIAEAAALILDRAGVRA
jgi:D-glycero-D-manno-heptose 1,7-bisphosphate phosphatase